MLTVLNPISRGFSVRPSGSSLASSRFYQFKKMKIHYKVMLQQINLLFLCFLRANTFSTASTSQESLQPQIYLRYARKADIPAIASINLRTLPENYTPYFYNSHLGEWPQLAWVAEDYSTTDEDNRPRVVAYVLGQIDRSWSNAVVKGHVTSLSVEPEYRRLGIGHELMSKLHESMKTFYSAENVVLHVRVSNKPALKLYTDIFKYKPVTVVKGYYQDGEDAYLMQYELQKRKTFNYITRLASKPLSKVTEGQ
mmetsp:Transcript_17160/g.22647  ORF Transcript_17160/g.22647 Transcript_17160/m.22647 type:complete len:253 (+) Transcript_17160:197-955(+)